MAVSAQAWLDGFERAMGKPDRAALDRLGSVEGPGVASGKFLAPHGIALDSKGNIYVGVVGVTDWKTSFPDEQMPAVVRATRCLQKLERVRE